MCLICIFAIFLHLDCIGPGIGLANSIIASMFCYIFLYMGLKSLNIFVNSLNIYMEPCTVSLDKTRLFLQPQIL